MLGDFETEDYTVGYGKPPKNGRFQKGVSGNPLGRPKKEPDFGTQVYRELNSKLTIQENGRKKVITKYTGMVKQLVNKALTGNLVAAKIVITHYQEELGKIAEKFRKSPSNPNLLVDDLSDGELLEYIGDCNRAELEASIKAKLEKSIMTCPRKTQPGKTGVLS